MSIEQTKKIQELEQRVKALEDIVLALTAAKGDGIHAAALDILKPKQTLTLPEKRKSA